MSDRISLHFWRSEFACRDGCGFDGVSMELVYLLEAIREHFNASVTITSACRCGKHNERVGGHSKSYHKQGSAADIIVRGVDPAEVYEYADRLLRDKGGVGCYNEFTHVDVRGKRARW